MENRLRLLRGATALLYFGPLLAGLGGFGWAVVPIFVSIFLLWLFILRPQQWPRRWADWARPEALVALLTQGVVQVLLVTVSFGIGRGLGGVLGALPPFPLMLPVAVSFLSVPLARLIWDPWTAGAANLLPDGAPDRPDQGDTAAAPSPLRVAGAARMVAALDELPADTPPEVLEAHLRAMASHAAPDALRVALMDPICDRTASPLHRRAAIVHATLPDVAGALAGRSYPAALFHELTLTEEVQLLANRCAELLRQRPDLAADCPDAQALHAAGFARADEVQRAAFTAGL